MYEKVTYEEILKRMLDRVSNRFDKREGSVIWDTHSPTAIELKILYIELDTIIREAYGDTASRDFLILRCKERGIIPYPATPAVLKGVFTPATVDVLGKRFSIETMNYIVTEKIADGEYKVECEEAGRIGNQYLGSMIPVEYINNLAAAELTEILIPGEDAEETEDLRERYFNSFGDTAFGGNMRDYLEKTNAIPGVGATKVTRVWNGDIAPADMIPTEAVNTWYESVIDTVNPDVKFWLSSVYHAGKAKKLTTGGTVKLTILDSEFGVPTDTLIQTVQETIDPEVNAGEGYGLAPIGHVVTVEKAEAVSVAVKTNITFDVGFGWTNLQNSIDETISIYFEELRRGWGDAPYLIVRVSQIETRILAIKGVVDIQDTRLNDAAENLTLNKFQVPVYGGASA